MGNSLFTMDSDSENLYSSIRSYVISAQNNVYSAVNSAMVTAYWEIGKQIYKACGENERAEYGSGLLKYLSDKLTTEFGKGFDESNLRRMRQFYCCFPIHDTLCHELSWSHYRILMKIADKKIRDFYTEECAKSTWSVRQLERQIHTMYYCSTNQILNFSARPDREILRQKTLKYDSIPAAFFLAFLCHDFA